MMRKDPERHIPHALIALFAVLAIILLLLLSGCTTKVAIPREGRHLGSVPIQEIEQCRAQPDFPGCENVGR